jgi:hypothetical protein
VDLQAILFRRPTNRRQGTLALGFWAAGYYGRNAALLIAWVAAFGQHLTRME